jgi:glycosyltransferase involved in cell wall biosynthesis
MSAAGRYVVVTPYYKEDRRLLERCIGSVRAQTVPTEHLLVADGFPQSWIDTLGVRHLRLDKAHDDYGNTPRGIGALLAAAEGYDAIALLDADNWLEPKHFELSLAAALSSGLSCDYVIARRNFMRPNETRIDLLDEPMNEHVDTNCFVFLPGSYHMLHSWALMPRGVSSLGDRVFYSALRAQRLIPAVVEVPTVNYHTMWEAFYRRIGEAPPSGAKPNVDPRAAIEWLRTLNDRQHVIASRHAGVSLGRTAK